MRKFQVDTKFGLLSLFCLLVLIPFDTYSQYRNVYKESAWEDRDNWQKAPVIISALAIEEGSKVADVGCHQGYMTVKLARVVGKTGKVYAVDIDTYQLQKLEENLKKRNLLNNVDIIKGDYNDPKLPENTLDAVIIMDTYHEMDEYESMLKHIKNALKPGGRIVIVEPIAEDRVKWSRARQEGKHEIAIRYVINDLRKAGFKLIQDIYPFVNREVKGDIMWMLIAQK